MSEEADIKTVKIDGVAVTSGGVEILDPSSTGLGVKGLRKDVQSFPPSEEFGESGDIFNHILWRSIMAVLWGIKDAKMVLITMASYLLIRGRQARVENHGKAITTDLPIGQVTEREADTNKIIGNGMTYPLTINYATDTSRVGSVALTPERFKCIMRMNLIPLMLKNKRFPAVAESNGYADLCRSLIEHGRVKATAAASVPSVNVEYAYWEKLISSMNPQSVKFVVPSAAVAGCVSTKEVYQWDEDKVSGCIFWCGVYSMMIDASNKIRLEHAPADVRNRLSSSSFYSDFKRKMTSRGITMVQTGVYLSFLQVMASAATRFLKAGTQMNKEESAILDELINAYSRKTEETIIKSFEESNSTNRVMASTALTAESELDGRNTASTRLGRHYYN